MKRHVLVDIIWAVVAGGGTLAGIIACARIQGSAQTAGLRIALISLAIALGLIGGTVMARATTSRRRQHRTGHSRRSRRQMRTVAFAIGGVIVACTVVGLSLSETTWLVVVLGLGALALTWLWYSLETLGLSRGAVPLRQRRSHRSRRDYDREESCEDEQDEEDWDTEHGADVDGT